MFRITAKPMVGSKDPRVFRSRDEPVEGYAVGPGSDVVLKFIGYPVARVMRLPLDQVLRIEHAKDGKQWRPVEVAVEEEVRDEEPEEEIEDDLAR